MLECLPQRQPVKINSRLACSSPSILQPRSQGLSSLPPLSLRKRQWRQRRETLGTRLSILLNDVFTVHLISTHSPSALEVRQHHLFLGDLVHPMTEIRSYDSLSNFSPASYVSEPSSDSQTQNDKQQQTQKCYSISIKFFPFVQAEDSLFERLTHWTWYPKSWAQIFRYDD